MEGLGLKWDSATKQFVTDSPKPFSLVDFKFNPNTVPTLSQGFFSPGLASGYIAANTPQAPGSFAVGSNPYVLPSLPSADTANTLRNAPSEFDYDTPSSSWKHPGNIAGGINAAANAFNAFNTYQGVKNARAAQKFNEQITKANYANSAKSYNQSLAARVKRAAGLGTTGLDGYYDKWKVSESL